METNDISNTDVLWKFICSPSCTELLTQIQTHTLCLPNKSISCTRGYFVQCAEARLFVVRLIYENSFCRARTFLNAENFVLLCEKHTFAMKEWALFDTNEAHMAKMERKIYPEIHTLHIRTSRNACQRLFYENVTRILSVSCFNPSNFILLLLLLSSLPRFRHAMESFPLKKRRWVVCLFCLDLFHRHTHTHSDWLNFSVVPLRAENGTIRTFKHLSEFMSFHLTHATTYSKHCVPPNIMSI